MRKALPSKHVGPCSYTVDGAGGFADFTLNLFGASDELTHIAATDRVEVWHGGSRQYRGYVSDLRRSEEEPASLELSGYGRVLDLVNQIIVGYYQYPDRVDVSRCFSEIAAEMTARHPEIVVQVDEIGSLVETLDTNGKTVKEALDALLEFARSSAVYGFDVDDLGRDRLYLRKIASTVSHTIVVPAASTGQREATNSIADLVNVVRVVGGDAKYPQMLPNPSMEILRKAGDGSGGNLVNNPGFETGGTGWTFSGGASRKTNGNDAPPAFSGNACAELDQPNEQVSQDHPVSATPLVPGKPYLFGFWIRGEYETPVDTPPTIRAEITWWDGNGYEIRTDDFVAEGRDQSWRQEEQVFVCPANAVGFRVSFRHVYGSYGNQRGAVIDDNYLQDASQMYVDGWRLVAHGNASIQAETARVGVGVGKHGRTAAYLKFTASNQDGQDCHFVYGRNQGSEAQGYTVGVVGGRTYRFSVWQKYQDNWAKPLQKLDMRWRKSDGSVLSTTRIEVSPNSTVTDWQEISIDFTAPNEAVAVEPWITMRSNGEMLLDCISLRNAADPDIDVFLDAGSLTVSFAADELLDAENDHELNASIATYGRREKSVSVSGITTIADARAWATEYLRVHALLNPAPQVTVYDYSKQLRCGDLVRLVGASGLVYSTNPVPVARVNAEIGDDGILVQNLELLTPVPTEEELYASKLREESNKIASSSGAAGATTLPRDGTVIIPSPSAPDASTTTKGISRLSVAPLSSIEPIAAGDNDPRMSDARTPLPHSQHHSTIVGGAANRFAIFDGNGNLASSVSIRDENNSIILSRSGHTNVLELSQSNEGVRISGGADLYWQSAYSVCQEIGSWHGLILSGGRAQNAPLLGVYQQGVGSYFNTRIQNINSNSIGLQIQSFGSATGDFQQWITDSQNVLARVTSAGVARFAGYEAADGTAGATVTTGGLQFKNGLYVSGSISDTATNPGGSTGSIQYRNASGAFAGDSNLVWDNINHALKIDTGAAGQLASLRLTTPTANRSRSLVVMTGEGSSDQAQAELWVSGGPGNYVPLSAPSSTAGDAGIRIRSDKSFWISDTGSSDQWRVKVASDGTVRPRGGYRSTDGTQGITTTTGGATFKDGLFVGGTISGGTSSNRYTLTLMEGETPIRNPQGNTLFTKREYILPYAADGTTVLYYTMTNVYVRLAKCSTDSSNTYENNTAVYIEKSTGSGAFQRPYGGSTFPQGEQICGVHIVAGQYEKIGANVGMGNVSTYPKSGDKILANVLQMGIGTDGYTVVIEFTTSTTNPYADPGDGEFELFP